MCFFVKLFCLDFLFVYRLQIFRMIKLLSSNISAGYFSFVFACFIPVYS